MTNQANTIWIKGFSVDGFQVSVTLEIADATQINTVLAQVRAQGIQPTPPLPTERESIVGVTRRVWHGGDGKEKHALDFYSSNSNLDYRKFTVYLDAPEDIDAFESATGVKVSSLPVLQSDQPQKAKHPNPTRTDIRFEVIYHIERDAEGKRRDTFAGYATAKVPASAPSPKVTPMPAVKKDDPSSADNTTSEHPYTKKPKHWTEDRNEATAFNAACRRYGLSPINALKNLEEGKRMVSFREITLTKEQAYARLEELAKKPAQPVSTSAMIDAVVEDRSKDKATADSPLVPDGFKTSDPIIDVPF